MGSSWASATSSTIATPCSPTSSGSSSARLVLSIKSECLDKLVLLGERHLRLAITEFVEHYHLERHHQGLDNQLITPPPLAPTPANDNSPVVRRERLGGLLNYYHRRAA